jgi:oligopeptide/dipeptide ABC transporter ATP-binding protein
MPSQDLSTIRGKEIAMIFQDPMTSLNPVFTIEKQLGEVLSLRFGLHGTAARARAMEMLQTVGIAEPEARLGSYPHELSGGMKQRVMIAMALLAEPKLLIADEPTTALDVTIQSQILYLIKELQKRTGAAVLFITHDMGVIAEMCNDVAVMYAGRIVEVGDVIQIFERSEHPYTKGLLRSLPRKGLSRKSELPTIEGVVPSLLHPPKGCRFAERCWHRREQIDADQRRCFDEDPILELKDHTLAACHFPVGAVPLLARTR